MKNKILTLDSSKIESGIYFDLFEKEKANIKPVKEIRFPIAEVVRVIFTEKDAIDESLLKIEKTTFKEILKDYYIKNPTKYKNEKIYEYFKNGFTFNSNKLYVNDIFDESVIKQLKETLGVTERESYLIAIHSIKLVVAGNEIKPHRVLGGSANNLRRKTLGYKLELKSLYHYAVKHNVEYDLKKEDLVVKASPLVDIRFIVKINEYLSNNKTTMSNSCKEINIKPNEYVQINKPKDLDYTDFLDKNEKTITSHLKGDAKKKVKLLSEIRTEFIKNKASKLIVEKDATKINQIFFDESKTNKNKRRLIKIDRNDIDIDSYNVYQDSVSNELIYFNEQDAYKELYSARESIFD